MVHQRFTGRPTGLPLGLAALLLILLTPAAARADAVRLRSGNLLTGIVVDATDDMIILQHPDLGRMPIPMDVIATIHWARADHAVVDSLPAGTPGESGDPESGDATKDPASAPEADEEETTYPWKISIVLGGSITNNDEGLKTNINGRLSVRRNTPFLATRFSASYLGKVDDGEVTDNEGTAIASNRWLHPETPWFTFATGRYDYDEFRSWTYRLQVHGGVGYDLIRVDDSFRLFAAAGLGARKDFGSIEEPVELEAQGGVGLEWSVSDRQNLTTEFDWYPEITGDSYRIVNITNWTYLIDASSRLSFNIHLNFEYDTDPDPGFPSDNYSLTWGLQWDW